MPTASATCSAKKASGQTTPPTVAWRWFCQTCQVKATITVSQWPSEEAINCVTKHWAAVQAEVRDQTAETQLHNVEEKKNFQSIVEGLISRTGIMHHIKADIQDKVLFLSFQILCYLKNIWSEYLYLWCIFVFSVLIGCPFRHSDPELLKQKLQVYKVPPSGISQVGAFTPFPLISIALA